MDVWDEMLVSTGKLDSVLRIVAAVLLTLWLLLIGMRFQAEYPREMIELSGQPWWRLLMVVAAMAAAYWCPRVGVLMAMAVVLYLADLRALVQL